MKDAYRRSYTLSQQGIELSNTEFSCQSFAINSDAHLLGGL